MKKIWLLTLITMFVHLYRLHAQDCLWGKIAPVSRLLSVDKENNIVTGEFYFYSTVIETDTFTCYYQAFCIIKRDASGNLLWAKTSSGNNGIPNNLTTDNEGNILVIGSFNANMIFGNDTLISPELSSSDPSGFVMKLDPSGNCLWLKLTSLQYPYGVTADNAGNIIVSGNGFIDKYDAAGNLLWTNSWGDQVAFRVTTDLLGNEIVAGFFYGTLTISGTTLYNTGAGGSSDIFIAKYDPLGNVKWVKQAGGASSEEVTAITSDVMGNTLLTGTFSSAMMFLDADTLHNKDSLWFYNDFFIAKYDTAGNVVWAKSGGGETHDYAKGVCTDKYANVFIAGSLESPSVILGTDTLYNTGESDMFICKYDASGNAVWAKSGVGNYIDNGWNIAVDTSNNIIAEGSFSSDVFTFGGMNFPRPTFGIVDVGIVMKITNPPGVTWPGDTDNNHIVNNNDLLPVGLYYAQTGAARTVANNLWQADSVADWGTFKYNYANPKHADCNGDGIIDSNDTLAINLNFNVTDVLPVTHIDSDATLPKIYFVTPSSFYAPGQEVDAELWLAPPSGTTADTLYGISFNIGYDSSLVEPGTENITFPDSSWLGNPGTNALTISKADPSVATAYGAIVRTNHINASGFGKIANFKFRVKNTITSNDSINLIVNNYTAVNAAGINVLFHSIPQNIPVHIFHPTVWPGDANNDSIVNNNDLLPIGLFYGQTGVPRDSISNVWQADPAADWGTLQTNGSDIKHADCNGDGIIDNNDTLAVNLNFSLVHAITVVHDETKAFLPEIYFATSASSYNPGETVDLEVWMGTTVVPITSLYGTSFNISYDPSFIDPGTESITYPPSWLGNPGINSITISKADPLAGIAYGAMVRTNHTNAAGHGKIADFKFRLKNTITETEFMHFLIEDYRAVDATGTPITLHDTSLSVQVNVGTVGVSETENATRSITVYPNPYTSFTTIGYGLTKKSLVTIEVYNTVGVKVETLVDAWQPEGEHKHQFSAKENGLTPGVYFIKITIDGKNTVKKIIEM